MNGSIFRPLLGSCPYCGERFTKIIRKALVIEFDSPKIPPLGARDLGLKDIRRQTYSIDYVRCSKCGASYQCDYGSYKYIPIEIPDDNTFIEYYSPNNLPPNTTYRIISFESNEEKE
jgi:hypothetical protein